MATVSLLPFSPTDPLDPWTALLEPALAGNRDAIFARFDSLKALLPPNRQAVLIVILARALSAAGVPRGAEVALAEGLRLSSPHAAVLARLAQPAPRAQRRATPPRLPGDRADEHCETAHQALVVGDTAAAVRAIEAALLATPQHAEARRWRRFLRSTGETAPQQLRAALACPTQDHGDATGLALSPRLGWMSPERWQRRVLSGAWPSPARPGTGLRRLQAVGVVSRVLAIDGDYALLGGDHALVDAELALDQALSLDREERPAGQAALVAWRAATAVDRTAQRDAAGALAALGVRNDDAASVGLIAVELLRAFEPEVPLWEAYEARLRAALGEHDAAGRAATRLLQRRPADPVAFALGVDALRRAGLRRAARRFTRGALARPETEAVARHLLQAWPGDHTVAPIVSNRLVSRRADMECAA